MEESFAMVFLEGAHRPLRGSMSEDGEIRQRGGVRGSGGKREGRRSRVQTCICFLEGCGQSAADLSVNSVHRSEFSQSGAWWSCRAWREKERGIEGWGLWGVEDGQNSVVSQKYFEIFRHAKHAAGTWM